MAMPWERSQRACTPNQETSRGREWSAPSSSDFGGEAGEPSLFSRALAGRGTVPTVMRCSDNDFDEVWA